MHSHRVDAGSCRYTEKRFPTDYVPTIFDNKTTKIKVDGQVVDLGLWDTAGQEEYARLRPLAYPNTDVFLVAFSVTERSSLNNLIKVVKQSLYSGTLKSKMPSLMPSFR